MGIMGSLIKVTGKVAGKAQNVSAEYNMEDVKNELLGLCEKEYLETIIDNKDCSRPPFWVFGKVNSVIGCFTTYIKPLYKVKLMKLLWYSDAFFYKNCDRSMTGLVYQHLPLGAVPVAYN